MKDFLDLYPEDGSGPYRKLATVCVCGHPFLSHSPALGVCMVIVPTQLMRYDGEPSREVRTYCACLDFNEGGIG